MRSKVEYSINWFKKYAKQKVRDVRCGLWSGFPPCCVAWHTLIWEPLHTIAEKEWSPTKYQMANNVKWWKKYIRTPNKKFQEYCLKINPRNFNPVFWQRVPCPWCALVNEPIDPKNCERHKLCQGKK